MSHKVKSFAGELKERSLGLTTGEHWPLAMSAGPTSKNTLRQALEQSLELAIGLFQKSLSICYDIINCHY